MKILILFVGMALLITGCDSTRSGSSVDKDNTGINERDASGNTKTPFDQSNDKDDIDLVANIRDKVLEIDDLSVSGRNVKIITEGNHVTLRGPVASASERDAIAKVAADLAGPGNVTNELEIESK